MKAIWWKVLFFVSLAQVAFLASFAFAAGVEIPTTDQQALGLFDAFVDAVFKKDWAMALGPFVALGVFGLRKYDRQIPKYGEKVDAFLNQPAVAFLLPSVVSAAGGFGTALAAHQPFSDAFKAALHVAVTAVFTYVGIKKVAEQFEAQPAPAPAAPADPPKPPTP